MANFDSAWVFLASHEFNAVRHFSNNPSDPGGQTNWGITQKELTSFNARHPELGFPANVEDLQQDQAKIICKMDYWAYDDVASDSIASKLLDMGFNFGTHLAVEYLQQTLGILGKFILVDGVFGPKTLAALNEFDEAGQATIMRYLVQYQRMHYINWVNKKLERQQFLAGLLRRASEIPQ